MSAFDQLHPLLCHHIVNSLGWRSLRPLQESAVAPILAGKHTLILAPTAGGKTEAALFPVFSRLLEKSDKGLRLLYICPIKALLNNLVFRLNHYAGLLGLRCDVWHGDVPESRRRRIRRDPPDILLTTPESLEVMLVSRRLGNAFFFGKVSHCIVDEIHAFAGDDRGHHLLATLHRIGRYAPAPIQRLGLSATVGNPEELLTWLKGADTRPGHVIAPVAETRTEPDISLDYVGGLTNAAEVISRLHRGEKRLVFCDSRARVEELAVSLRARGVATFVSHGSLGIEERRAAEAAFAQGENCVIVATSTLELGMDVGDLDRVIQIDAPNTVASFLQRIGRTGRRSGSKTNCLFLATNDSALMRAAGLLRLWRDGYVEPVIAPPLPFHILAQQMMALCLERGALAPDQMLAQLEPVFPDLSRRDRADVLTFMRERELLSGDGGLLWMGDEGEAQYGRRHFMELFTVFVSPPEFRVMHGRKEIGQVHQQTFITAGQGPMAIILAGRRWVVRSVDWKHKAAQVVPGKQHGKSLWLGGSVPHSFALCQAVADVLDKRPLPEGLFTRRGSERFAELCEEMAEVDPGSARLVADETGKLVWWTFAGTLLNEVAAASLREMGFSATANPLAVVISEEDAIQILAAIKQFLALPEQDVRLPLKVEMLRGLKFSECLPPAMIERLFAARLDVRVAFRHTRERVAAWSSDQSQIWSNDNDEPGI